MLKDLITDDFQYTVSEQLICNRSILDILSRHHECTAKLNSAVVKTVTGCGCLKIEAKKTAVPEDLSLVDLKNLFDSHLYGKLCPKCREKIENEIGRTMVYLAALCNSLDLNLFDIIIKEHKKMKLLRQYNLT